MTAVVAEEEIPVEGFHLYSGNGRPLAACAVFRVRLSYILISGPKFSGVASICPLVIAKDVDRVTCFVCVKDDPNLIPVTCYDMDIVTGNTLEKIVAAAYRK